MESHTLLSYLSSINQRDIFFSLSEEQKDNLVNDIRNFDKSYPEGIESYIKNVRKLINPSSSTNNSIVSIEIPIGEDVNVEGDDFDVLECIGKEELCNCCFSIVGGGIGERLGSSKAKLCLISNVITGDTFLGNYCSFFRAIECHFNCHVPVAIMTSVGTHSQIYDELERNNYYGLQKDLFVLMPQIEVPAVTDSTGRLSLQIDGHLFFKPHGHGDIHTLLYQNQLPQKWLSLGKKHVIFMQDTNILAPYGFASLLGIAVTKSLSFASLGIVRKPHEKVGSICRLNDGNGNLITCNVEYNEFESLLQRLTGSGDIPNNNGNSSYPGNINVLYAELGSYKETLTSTHGCVPEFINPKYADETKIIFSSPARLECMMQDLPKVMSQKANVGYCSLPRWVCFSAAKNNPKNALAQERQTGFGESIDSMEEDYYKLFRKVLRHRSFSVGNMTTDENVTPAEGIPSLPIVIVSPAAALTLSDMNTHFYGNNHISNRSVLIIDGNNVLIENLSLDGTLIVRACEGANVYISNKRYTNKGWEMKPRCCTDAIKDELRQYSIEKHETEELIFEVPGTYYV